MSDAPRALISHAAEDKAGYAEPLALALISQGVDAWIDKWEMLLARSPVRICGPAEPAKVTTK
jgi:hypothetical protein